MKKSAAEPHWSISDIYGETAISDRSCREWFQSFMSGDFSIEDRHSGERETVVEDAELEEICSEDSWHTQEELSESLGISQQAKKDIGYPASWNWEISSGICL